MELGVVGLGRMGMGITKKLLSGGHWVVVYNRSSGPVQQAIGYGAIGTGSLAELTQKLNPPRAIWMMLPAGDPVEQTIATLLPHLSPGDILVDGGNSHYEDSRKRAQQLKEKGIIFLDIGTSGGIWGEKEGFCLMVGGEEKAFQRLVPALNTLAQPNGDYAYVGSSGAGHFVKMVHNGIEYGLMEAYAEGFELLKAKKEFDLDLHQLSTLWQKGSVIRSWLLELIAKVLSQDAELSAIVGYVEDSGEGRWTVKESVELAVPAPVIALALQARFRSRQRESFGAKLLAALRQQFGGHPVRKL